ncbi:sensor domain-containing diguanylate cyclase [Undibacterium sp. Ji49W]|uniref:sensor domain-containing diguanylate cyclase n=1 Tax=Undibacterium sp. Ji49W TaxID=3413040 RepID=UPI003BF0CA3F
MNHPTTLNNAPASTPRKLSLTWLAMGFVVFVCVSLIFIDGWRSWTARQNQLREMSVSTTNMARAIAQHADDTIKAADTALLGIEDQIQTDGTEPAALERLHNLLMRKTAELPQLKGLFVYDENGNWLVNSLASTPANINNADRDYFIYHRTHQDKNAYIGSPIRSRSSGIWVMTLSRRINHADGSFAGVALATIEIDYFNKFYDSFNIGEAGAIVLVSNNGTMLTRRPLLPDSIGKNMQSTTVFKESAARPSGTFNVKSAQDGVKRLNSFRRLDKYPLFVSAAVSEDEILADWLTDTYLHSAGVGLLVIALASIGFYLIGQMKLRLNAEAEVIRARDAMIVLNKTLERLSLQDALTELANRRNFDITLEEEFSRAIRNASSLALIMIDVDHFKQYNDLYGHAAGDECLRKISQAVKSCQNRAGDLTARYGGEELAVILPTTDVEGALLIAERIRAAIHNLGISHAGNEAGIVTVSAGVEAIIPVRDLNKPVELIEAADNALYAAKKSGRDRVCSNFNMVGVAS